MKKTPPTAASKKRGRPPKNSEAMEIICISVTPYQKEQLGRDRSDKTRKALVLAGYAEKEPTP